MCVGAAEHRPVAPDEHRNVLISHPGGIRRHLPLKASVLGDGHHHVQGKGSVNKTEKSLKRGILDLIISREAEHCEIYARQGGG